MAKPFSPFLTNPSQFLTNHNVSSNCLTLIKIQIGLTHSKLFCTRLGYPMQGCIALSACVCLYLDPLSLLILLTYISSCFWNYNWIVSVSFCFYFYFHFLYLCSLYSMSIIFVLLCSLSILFLSCAGARHRPCTLVFHLLSRCLGSLAGANGWCAIPSRGRRHCKMAWSDADTSSKRTWSVKSILSPSSEGETRTRLRRESSWFSGERRVATLGSLRGLRPLDCINIRRDHAWLWEALGGMRLDQLRWWWLKSPPRIQCAPSGIM